MSNEAVQAVQNLPNLVTMDQASWELRKSHSAIYYRVRMGEIAAYLVDGRVLVDLNEVRRRFENPQRVGVRRKLMREFASQNKGNLF